MCNPLDLINAVIAPRRCAGCSVAGEVLCPGCSDSLMTLGLPPVVNSGLGPMLAAFPYLGRIRGLIHRSKYRDGRSLLLALTDLAVERLPVPCAGEALVAVPLGGRRRRDRGYNQAELVAGRLARAWGCPTLAGLARVRETPPQVGTDAEARRANVAGCFAWRGGEIRGRRLIVVDDVITTGATTDAAVGVLAANGAASVGIVALARVL